MFTDEVLKELTSNQIDTVIPDMFRLMRNEKSNRNIYLPSFKSGTAKVYRASDDKWVFALTNPSLDKIGVKLSNVIEGHVQKIRGHKRRKKCIGDYIQNIVEGEENYVKSRMRDEMKIELLNESQ